MIRKNTALAMKVKAKDSMYFTPEYAKETISKDRQYQNGSREKRPIYTYKTGGTYEGEWLGGIRDGYGV